MGCRIESTPERRSQPQIAIPSSRYSALSTRRISRALCDGQSASSRRTVPTAKLYRR
jgi:hypothetical protein